MIICPVCNINETVKSSSYGVLPCIACQARRSKQSSPDHLVEFTSNSIKSQRKEYAKSIIAPYRSGELSKEYLDAYGTKNIKPTAKEVKKAKYVWGDANRGVDLKKTK